ncbi:glucose-1-phosphate adenylyltransferase [Geosporobacter subterraneus DSM 17957]|uniref:Glucose-1-phosphate adenylyltransferase n=1 Tax=Geosporobacter subterraneus DSM 17957 TaxID=1121919 RepID=A0A1M6P968_9FIRM|nr:glucose-1-phosphate adenylyltransferase subunit GlgD [Geosporobacter subterraneus]SHK04440.1 glucose-1-phosphate adenylyltransferase [Geosporobacter subterraneus DSM 17957]
MSLMMGIINNTKNGNQLKELTENRYMASVPFGGRYRMIDFVLSNMVNSGIRNVGILVQGKYRSLMDHLRSGKEWDLDRKRDGLFILPPAYNNCPLGMQKGDLDNFYANLEYLQKSRQKYVVISGANMVCNINYQQVLQMHQQKQADITIIYTEELGEVHDASKSTFIYTTSSGRVVDLEINPITQRSNKISMEMYILERTLLIDIIDECISKGGYDFVMDGILKNLQRYKIYGHHHPGYVGRIHSVQSYYRHNMDLLNSEIWEEVFLRSGLIYTKVKDQAPVKYMEHAVVKNALVANGCVINGSVENSVLFRGVRIHKGAKLRNCIILQNCVIGEDAELENVILDKEVHVSAEKQLAGLKEYPIIVEKKSRI